MAQFPVTRLHRLRSKEGLRCLTKETRIHTSNLVYPVFVTEGSKRKEAINAMPGICRFSVDLLPEMATELYQLGIRAILLFGVTKNKDETGTEAYNGSGIVERAVQTIKHACPEMMVITDVCLCEYTSHGHCGIIKNGQIDNDATLPMLSRMALSHARAGADMVAPSDMMDGRVKAIRNILDENDFGPLPIMVYSAKFASAFYGPFREACRSCPSFGDRRGYQMDYSNPREALREVEQDIWEGADIVMVKPALAYLDIISQVRSSFNIPVAAYNVSGEYSMVKLAAREGLVDEKKIVLELLSSIKRAGANIIISYHARDFAMWLANGES